MATVTQNMRIPVEFDVHGTTMLGPNGKNETIYSGHASIFGTRVASLGEYVGCKSEAQAIKYLREEINC